MSFILDALKKIDAQRGAPGDGDSLGAIDLDTLDRERLRRRRHLASLAVIALLSAGATALGLRVLSPRGEESARGSVDGAAGTAGTVATVTEAETPRPTDEGLSPTEPPASTVSKSDDPPRKEPAAKAASRGPTKPRSSTVVPEPPKESSVARGSVAPPQSELHPPENPDTKEPPAAVEAPPSPDASLSGGEAAEEPDSPEAEPSSPGTIRLVGQASPERSASEASDRRPVPEQEPLPKHFPQLELQGTSVIDGSPVAVISDRRVFEGDTIDGARVIRIEERAVTLEFEGRRFTITL